MDRVYSAGKVSEGPISESVCLVTCFHLLVFFVFLIVLGIELKVMYVLDKCSAPELHLPSFLSINHHQLWCTSLSTHLYPSTVVNRGTLNIVAIIRSVFILFYSEVGLLSKVWF